MNHKAYGMALLAAACALIASPVAYADGQCRAIADYTYTKDQLYTKAEVDAMLAVTSIWYCNTSDTEGLTSLLKESGMMKLDNDPGFRYCWCRFKIGGTWLSWSYSGMKYYTSGCMNACSKTCGAS
jgi:hypothetical protein